MGRWHALSPLAVAALCAGLVAITATHAPAQEWRPAPGDRSIEFALPSGGGGALGLWWHPAEHRAWALRLTFSTNGDLRAGGDDPGLYRLNTAVGVGPAFKRYRGTIGPVSPFIYSGFGVRLHWDRTVVEGGAPQNALLVGGYGDLGLGVDWFPLERISIGGHTGGRLTYHVGFPENDSEPWRHALSLQLMTSELSFHIYF